MLTRRSFIKTGAVTGCCLCGAGLAAPGLLRAMPKAKESFSVKEAKYYEKQEEKKLVCKLCPHECRVADLERGTCGVRENRGGTYHTLVYGNPCAAHIDPIEKKPLFHYMPTSRALSIATAGCNIVCKFCQNWEISQKRPEQVKSMKLLPETVISYALQKNCQAVAHTYTEPVIFFEYMLECAKEGKRRGVPNVMISNGFIQEKPMRELCKYLGAVKIDLKGFSEKFYNDICDAKLKPVLDTLLVLKDEGIWFEIVVLIIPTLNDGKAEIADMSQWIFKNLGPNIPIHFSRYYPTFMLKNIPPTPPDTLQQARNIAMEKGNHYVYVGNLISDSEHTYCPSCNKILIERLRYNVRVTGLKKNKCKYCKTTITGVF